MIVYLLFAEAQNMLLSAILTFSDRVVHPVYRAAGPSALDDQALAGVIMWVPGSAVLAVALLGLAFEALAGQPSAGGDRAPRLRCPTPSGHLRTSRRASPLFLTEEERVVATAAPPESSTTRAGRA